MDLTTLWYIFAKGADLACVLACVWAFWKGGSAERIGAAIIGISWILSVLLTFAPGAKPTAAIVAIDVVVLILFVTLSALSRRIWVVCISACQLLAVAAHMIGEFSKHALYGYVTAIGFWGGWALVICLTAGTFGYQRALRATQHKRRNN